MADKEKECSFCGLPKSNNVLLIRAAHDRSKYICSVCVEEFKRINEEQQDGNQGNK